MNLEEELVYPEVTKGRYDSQRLGERASYIFTESSKEQDPGTRASTKKADSLFTSRAKQYGSAKDSLLLYDSYLGDEKKTKAVHVQRRHLSGAKDHYFDNQISMNQDTDFAPKTNFEKGRHPWYGTAISKNEQLKMEMHQNVEQSVTTNSTNIKNVIDRAAESIAKSQYACQNIKDRLEKYNLSRENNLPGTFIETNRSGSSSYSSESNHADSPDPIQNPIQYVPQCLFIPILLKLMYFFLMQVAASESRQYSFTTTCSMILSAEHSSFTILQLDDVILQCTEVWLVTKILPFLANCPWRFYKITSEYKECCRIGRDIFSLQYANDCNEMVLLCKIHRHQSEFFYKLSILILVISPFGILFGFLLLHCITFNLASRSMNNDPYSPVYTSLMLVLFSSSQLVMLSWCLFSQFFKDGVTRLYAFINEQNEKFIQDTEFVAEQIDSCSKADIRIQHGKANSSTNDAKSPGVPRFQMKSTSLEECCVQETPHREYLKSYTPLSYESPLKGKDATTLHTSIIRPVSPCKPLPSPTKAREFRSRGILRISLGFPLKLVSLYYQSIRLFLKLVVFIVLIAASTILRPRS